MLVKDAIQAEVAYPLTNCQLCVIALKRGLDPEAQFNRTIAGSKDYELTYADCLRLVITHPNVSEGGVSISISDRKSLLAIANGIYRKYDEPLILEERPAVYPIDE